MSIANDRPPSSWGGPEREWLEKPGYLKRIVEKGFVQPSVYAEEKRRASGRVPYRKPGPRGRAW
jgi:hypothetical protein